MIQKKLPYSGQALTLTHQVRLIKQATICKPEFALEVIVEATLRSQYMYPYRDSIIERVIENASHHTMLQ